MSTFWGFFCVNPPGNLYSACLSGAPSITPQFAFNQDEFEVAIPEDSLRALGSDPNLPPSGTAYVFYGICAGTLSLFGQEVGPKSPSSGGGGMGGMGVGGAPEDPAAGGAPRIPIGAGGGQGSLQDLPLGLPRCLDDEGEELGASDFVVGYSSVLIYSDLRNQNPQILGFEVDGKEVAIDCIDEECVGVPFREPSLDRCEPGVACIESCAEDGAITCPEIAIRPVLKAGVAEVDEVALLAYQNELEEAVWVSYFLDRGALESDLRLVNDATTGLRDDYEATLFAPKKKGPMRLWAVVRDSRGGVSWARLPAYVK